ncbi:MAG: cellulase family glycosylhydrolase [Candidatus Doudnabacteria bacterium]|nr:cellulase family glycosylhydrolase [Candidatus Doudnabacteria bacterium]
MKSFLKKFTIFLILVLLAVWLVSLVAPKSKNIQYGITFSAPYAQSLGLDWKQAYTSILNDLQPKYIRLSAYWDKVEPEPDKFVFGSGNDNDLDFQVSEASRRGTKIVLAVGRRLPRWPECHDPSWIKDLPEEVLENDQLSYVEAVVKQYQSNPQIIAWQVENEPFLSTFGICPPLNTKLLDSEIALVKKMDPSRPVIITDSGELSLWYHSGSRGDIFGTTFYRYVFSDVFKRYWTNHIPAIYYRFKGGLLRLLNPGKPIAIMELETEPWTTAGIPNTPIEEQFKTMSIGNFNTIVKIAKDTGYSPQYLWGVEWWYWMKQKDHPEFWQAAKELFKQ